MTIKVIGTEELNKLISEANCGVQLNLAVMSVILTHAEIQSTQPEIWDEITRTLDGLKDMTFTCSDAVRSGKAGKSFTFTCDDEKQVVQTLQYVRSIVCEKKHIGVHEFQPELNSEDVRHSSAIGIQAVCPLFK